MEVTISLLKSQTNPDKADRTGSISINGADGIDRVERNAT